jgi:hypothetical protein
MSPDFRQHACAHFIEPLLAARDRSEFRVIAYSSVVTKDAVTARLKGQVDAWRDVASMKDPGLANLLAEDKVDIAIDDWGKLSSTTFLATEVPEVIEKLGIGAFISPQRLDEEGDSVVLDLAKGELRSAWFDEQQRAMGESGTPLFEVDSARTCDDSDGPIRGLAYVVPATIEAQKVSLLIDTGAQHSDVFASSTPGRELVEKSTLNKEAMYTASGKVQARTLRAAHITAGSVAVTSDVGLIQGAPDASCPRDGVLAMDVLRSCTLLLGRSKVYGRCLQK